MNKIDNEELKKIQMEILDNVAEFCSKNDIRYWLDGGTLIGAVRHKGYIPWDDDIDIGMLRPDYDRFIELYNKKESRFRLFCVENSKEYALPIGKVIDTETVLYEPDINGRKLGVNIDIFVYDNAPDDDREVAKMFRKRNILRACNTAHSQKKDYIPGVKRRIGFLILHAVTMPFPKNFFSCKVVENSKRYMNFNTRRVGNFMGYTAMTCEKDVFSDFRETEFEGKRYNIPIGYDKWLRAYYGDYMQLPPEEKRVSHHLFEAWRIEE